MNTTRSTLLERIRDLNDDDAWREFRRLYAPLLYRYARARGLSPEDAEDVRAKCYETVVMHIGEFAYERQRGGFKAWLRTMADRRVIDLLRKRREVQLVSGALEARAAADENPDLTFERIWQAEHLRYCVAATRVDCSESTFRVFEMLVLEELTVPDVCRRLNLNRNQVYKAKARVLDHVRRRMREIGATSA